jgi:hypothetical protein
MTARELRASLRVHRGAREPDERRQHQKHDRPSAHRTVHGGQHRCPKT